MSVTMDTYTVNANELTTMQAARLRMVEVEDEEE